MKGVEVVNEKSKGDPDRKRVGHYRECLNCGSVVTAENYTCPCGEEKWTDEYRLTEVRFDLSADDKQKAKEAFENYRMDHPRGMLQYFLIPHREFADHIGLKIGLTPLIGLPELSETYGRSVYLKDEGYNPGGCFKDRETAMAALHSLARKKEKIVIYSSGNAAASAALMASHLNFELVTFVAGDTYEEKVEYIRRKGSDVVRIGNDKTNFESGYRLFSQLNNEGLFMDRGYDNWSVRNPYRVSGDKTTAIEIIKQYRSITHDPKAVPDYIVVPTGNGSCLAGIWKGLKEMKMLGVIDRYPKLISAAIRNASPVYKAFQKGLRDEPAICDLDDVTERDLEIGSVIVAEEGYDSISATNALFESGGTALQVTRQEVRKALVDLLDKEDERATKFHLLPEPASLVALAAAAKLKNSGIGKEGESVIAVITGHGAKARNILLEMLENEPKLTEKMKAIIRNRDSASPQKNTRLRGRLIEVGADIREIRNAFKAITDKIHGPKIQPIQ